MMAMRWLLAAVAAFGCTTVVPLALGQNPVSADPSAKGQVELRGAGATFPAPLYQKWIAVYTKANPNISIEYQDIGSGEGSQAVSGRKSISAPATQP
jgi:phosphate transport system substrate-binding protein